MADLKTPKAARGTSTEELLSQTCAVDGARLEGGWCPTGRGYALAANVTFRDRDGVLRRSQIVCRCPFVCQSCRQPLEWTGGCLACDSHAPGARIQGDRYELETDEQGRSTGHYRLVQRAPLRLATREEALAGLAHMRELLGGIGRLPWARRELPAEPVPAWVTDSPEDDGRPV